MPAPTMPFITSMVASNEPSRRASFCAGSVKERGRAWCYFTGMLKCEAISCHFPPWSFQTSVKRSLYS